MKHFRAVLCCCVLFCLVLPLSSCSEPYPFPDQFIAVDRIELLYYPRGFSVYEDVNEFHLIRELEPSEFNEFIHKIHALRTDRGGHPPRSDYGPFIARVTYRNGDVEYLGSYHIEHVRNGESPVGCGTYYFVAEYFEVLFFEYALDAIINAE